MLFQQHCQNVKSSKQIGGHPEFKRASRRQSRPFQFKIPNPVSNMQGPSGFAFVPNMPTAIKNQLAGMEYLTYSNVNNIGNLQQTGTCIQNKRNSRFSKRLMAMQNALMMQDLKIRNIETGVVEQHSFFNENQGNQENYMSMMQQQKNSINMQYVMGQNLDQDIDYQLQMCGQQSQITEIQFYSQNEIRPQINYEEYESYLNV